MDGRESRNKKTLSLNEHQIFHPIQSRLSVNGDLSESNEEIFFSEKIIQNLPNVSHHNEYPSKPKIIESRLKTTTTQYYQSEEDLRPNDDSNHLLSKALTSNQATTVAAAAISSLTRKQSLLLARNNNKDECFNSNNNIYETNLDVERSNLNRNISTSTLSNYANVISCLILKNFLINDFLF